MRIRPKAETMTEIIFNPRRWNVPLTMVGSLVVMVVTVTTAAVMIRSDLATVTKQAAGNSEHVSEHDERLDLLERNEAVGNAVQARMAQDISEIKVLLRRLNERNTTP